MLPYDALTQLTTYSILSEDKKEEYRSLQEDYKRDLRRFDLRTTGMGKIRSEIQRSVARQNLSYTFNCSTAREMITNLQQRFSLTRESRERELIARYTHFRTGTVKGQGIDKWLSGFEKVYTDCTKANLPDV
jgi:hypothetical protein